MSPTKDRTRGVIGITVIFGMLAVLGFVLLTPTTKAGPAPTFEAKFENSTDFTNDFDHGYSGISQADPQVNGATLYHGDHDASCGSPDTLRQIHVTGDDANVDAEEVFWWCAPGGVGTGHVMTGMLTFGYNHAWFSPKQEYSNISAVCWDINETAESSRKWTEVQFVDDVDAHLYPAGSPTGASTDPRFQGVARGSGGFDLGYTLDGFNTSLDPNNGLFSRHDLTAANNHVAGLKELRGTEQWQNGDGPDFVGGGNQSMFGWPGFDMNRTITDKATRYKHCITDDPANDRLIVTMEVPPGMGSDVPGGTMRTVVIPGGHIPQDARKVVFHDANYDPPKAADYPGDQLNTWHWDNIQIFTNGTQPTTTTTTTEPPTTTTTEPPTTEPPTTTTTESSTTTTESTTTTQPPQPDQLTWTPRSDNTQLLDGFLGTIHLFTIRERNPDNLGRYPARPFVLSAYIGYPTSRTFWATLDEAKASAEQQLDDFQSGTGLGP